MKLIQKTGSKPESKNSTKTKQFGLFECPVCKEHVEKPLSHGRRNKSCGKRECRKATLVWTKPKTKIVVNPIKIENKTTSRNKLRYYDAFRLWYKRVDKRLLDKSINTLEKAADVFYVEYETLKMQYPNQPVNMSLKDPAKCISKENAYFTLRSKASGLTVLENQIRKLSKDLGISKDSIKSEIGEEALSTEAYENLFTTLLYKKYSHSKQTEYLYLIKGGEYTKIGVAENPEKRLNAISTGCPFKPEIIATKQLGKLCYLVERYLHIKYVDKGTNGEWFELEESDIEYIKNTSEEQLVKDAAMTIAKNKQEYVESTRVYNDEDKLNKLRLEAEERYIKACENYEESKRQAREANVKPVIETTHEYGDVRFAHDRTNQIEATTTHGMVGTAIYAAWQTVKKIYGVSKEWEQFEQFMKDIGAEYDAFAAEDVARVYPVDTANPVSPTNYAIKAKKDHIVKSAVARSVLQLKDGEVIAEYDSVTEAAKSVDGIASKISAVCKGSRKIHAGFGWVYKE